MIKNLSDLEKSLKLKEGTLKAAIESTEEVAVEIPKLRIYTEEEENARVENLKTEFKTAGVEIAIKQARDKHGLNFTGKYMDNLLDAFKQKVVDDANINPDKRVADLMSDNEKLRKNLETKTAEHDQLQIAIKKERSQAEIDNSILANIPEKTILPKNDLLTLFKSKYTIDPVEGGGMLFKMNGETLKDPATLNPLTAKDVVSSFVTPYLEKPDGGRGGIDDPGKDKPGSLAAFTKEMETKNINEGSEEYNKELQKRIKEKTLVI